MARWALALSIVVTAVARGTKSILDSHRADAVPSHAFRVTHNPWLRYLSVRHWKVTHGSSPCPQRSYGKSFEVCLKANNAYLHLRQGVQIHFAGTVRVALQRLNLLASNSSHESFALAEKKSMRTYCTSARQRRAVYHCETPRRPILQQTTKTQTFADHVCFSAELY